MPDEQKDLNTEEATSTETGHSENNESADDSQEESVDYWRQKYQDMEQERDNYKAGLLSKKGKRDLSLDKKESDKDSEEDISESKVASVLDKRNEKAALESVVDQSSESYIPELVNDAQYSEIIGYLPRNLDKSSPQKIVKALKLATKLWKEDKGISDTKSSEDKTGEVATMKTQPSGSTPEEKKKTRTILRNQKTIDSWY